MCLAIPAKVEAIEADDMAVVSVENVRKRVSVALVEDVAVGDFVLIHVGFALNRLSEDEAKRTLKLMAEGGILAGELEEMGGEAACDT